MAAIMLRGNDGANVEAFAVANRALLDRIAEQLAKIRAADVAKQA